MKANRPRNLERKGAVERADPTKPPRPTCSAVLFDSHPDCEKYQINATQAISSIIVWVGQGLNFLNKIGTVYPAIWRYRKLRFGDELNL